MVHYQNNYQNNTKSDNQEPCNKKEKYSRSLISVSTTFAVSCRPDYYLIFTHNSPLAFLSLFSFLAGTGSVTFCQFILTDLNESYLWYMCHCDRERGNSWLPDHGWCWQKCATAVWSETIMAGETGVDREGPSPPGPINSIAWVGPGGTHYITKMGPFYLSWTVSQQLQ